VTIQQGQRNGFLIVATGRELHSISSITAGCSFSRKNRSREKAANRKRVFSDGSDIKGPSTACTRRRDLRDEKPRVSATVGLNPTPGLSFKTPFSWSSSRTVPPLVGSFGIDNVPPTVPASQLLRFFE
jgi:hypothetical protein